MQSLTFTKKQYQKMIAYVDSHVPLEACGLLAGHNSKVEAVLEVPSQAQSEVRFVMDPIEQLNAFEWIDANGMELIGIFHSHPTGPETVSQTDISEAAYAVAQVILAHAENSNLWSVRGFWIEGENYNEIAIEIC